MFRVDERNVNDAFSAGMSLVEEFGIGDESRNGPVRALPAPLCTTYFRPQERVLFNTTRRANPFFHLAEAMWMLAGRRDSAFLDQFVGDFGARFAEKSGVVHGAYGHRWRVLFGFDQLDHVINAMRSDPRSRRQVIAMWDPMEDLGSGGRDVPCNTHIYPRIHSLTGGVPQLDLTVCCRSNDLVWGLYGSNAVHFSILLEYMAWMIGADVGFLHVLSNNAHVYQATRHLWDPEEAPSDLYATGEVRNFPLFESADRGKFMRELLDWMDAPGRVPGVDCSPIFHTLLVPMMIVHDAYRLSGAEAARHRLNLILHPDWREAARLWLSQRRVAVPEKEVV